MPAAHEDKLVRYEKLAFLGEGQFATVYKARDMRKLSEAKVKAQEAERAGHVVDAVDPDDVDFLVAIKKIKLGSRAEAKDGIHRTALREIKLLQELRGHPNVIELRDVFGHKSNISLVMDFMDTDLEVVVKDTTIVLTSAHIKCYIVQTLLGLEFLHDNWILHRDLKPNNLLINSKGVLKIGDFGLAKAYGSPSRPYTHMVVTRWYRAPELLFGARFYSTGIDIWAVGCILAELLLRLPFMAGETDLDQLAKIFQALGTPTEETWPGHTLLPDYVQFKTYVGTPLRDIFTAAGPDLISLLERFLALDPNHRCTCAQALQMDYFRNKPYPSPGDQLPLPAAVRERLAGAQAGGGAAGTKRKMRDGLAESGLAKRLVF